MCYTVAIQSRVILIMPLKDKALRAQHQRDYAAKKKANATPEELEAMRVKQRAYSRKSYHTNAQSRERAKERNRKRRTPALSRVYNARQRAKHGDRIRADQRKAYATESPEQRAHRQKNTATYRAEHRDELNERAKQDYLDNAEQRKQQAREWRQRNPDKVRQYSRSIKNRCRVRILNALRRSDARKVSKTTELLGCTAAELRHHLEAQFVDGMSWDNRPLWHIDHIIPCCTFDLTDPQQQRECFHYTNLRPLWKIDNLKRPRSKYTH
jgi:hypothetical protein